MRRFLAFWLAVSLLVLAGCGTREAEPSQPEPPAVTAPDIDTPTTSPNEPAENTPPAETSTPVQTGLFAEQILSDLIAEGFSGEELLQKFKERQAQVRPAVEAMIAQAEGAAQGTEAYESYEDVFGAGDDA